MRRKERKSRRISRLPWQQRPPGAGKPAGGAGHLQTVQAAEGENLPENAEDTEFTLKLTAVRDDNVPLTGTFFCEVYNDENPNTASGSSVTFDPSGAAALAIKSGQVIRLFLPKGTSVTVSEGNAAE